MLPPQCRTPTSRDMKFNRFWYRNNWLNNYVISFSYSCVSREDLLNIICINTLRRSTPPPPPPSPQALNTGEMNFTIQVVEFVDIVTITRSFFLVPFVHIKKIFLDFIHVHYIGPTLRPKTRPMAMYFTTLFKGVMDFITWHSFFFSNVWGVVKVFESRLLVAYFARLWPCSFQD